ncbi:hypothetical protein PRIPAC_83571, partial [Pristionchus pacificus]
SVGMSSEGSSGVSTSDSDIEDFLKEIDTKMARIRELCKPFDKSRESFQEYHNRIQKWGEDIRIARRRNPRYIAAINKDGREIKPADTRECQHQKVLFTSCGHVAWKKIQAAVGWGEVTVDMRFRDECPNEECWPIGNQLVIPQNEEERSEDGVVAGSVARFSHPNQDSSYPYIWSRPTIRQILKRNKEMMKSIEKRRLERERNKLDLDSWSFKKSARFKELQEQWDRKQEERRLYKAANIYQKIAFVPCGHVFMWKLYEASYKITADRPAQYVCTSSFCRTIRDMIPLHEQEYSDQKVATITSPCGICLDDSPPRRVAFTRCGHSLCLECADHLTAMAVEKEMKVNCPFCRADDVTYVVLVNSTEKQWKC